MIASQHNNVTREVKFDGEEKHADFDAKDATVNIVAKEQVVRIWWEPTILEESQEIVVLTVHIA